jgi:serine/threonine-protein kinase
MPQDESIQEFLEKFGLPDDARDEVERLIRVESESVFLQRRSVYETLGPEAPKPITLYPHELFETWIPDPTDSVLPEDDSFDELVIQEDPDDLVQIEDEEPYMPPVEEVVELPPEPPPELPPEPPLGPPQIPLPEPPVGSTVLSERFNDLGLIGIGGMGEVRRALDRDLNRVVALKIIRPELMRNTRAVARFVEEAQTTGQLQHPAIVPVHEMGRLADGRLYFTMLEVKGRNFEEIIIEYHRGRSAEPDESLSGVWSFRRLVDIFLKSCEAVAYAHARGVIHRDLKPGNVLVGAYGEVIVADWGLAKIMDHPEAMADLDDEDRIVTARSMDKTKATLAGTIAGTPAYMPLEQAMGLRDRQGPHSDVYSLGAILYEVLSGSSPYVGDTAEHVLKQVLQGPPPVPEGPEIPSELLEICMRAMERDPKMRYQDGRALADSVSAWLDGARRREHALDLVDQARTKLQQIRRLHDRANALKREARAFLAELSPTDPVEVKRVGWQREEEAQRLDQGANVLEVVVQQLARASLEHVPNLPEARAFLADLFQIRHADAESRRDPAAEQYKFLLRAHDSGRYAGYLAGVGALTLVTDPPEAKVEFFRYEEEDRRLVEVPTGQTLTTPLVEAELEMGSYLLVIKTSYRPPVRYPVQIGRNQHWDGVPPGASETEPIHLPPGTELGENDCYVPAGWYWSGGDPIAANALSRRRVWVNALVCRRFAVTNREYIEFLDDLVAQRRQEDAFKFAPRARGGTFGSEGPLVYGQDTNGLFYLQLDPDGNRWGREWPVLLISWHGANAYASWRSVLDGLRWRLPTEYEWEKVARGVDGRAYPWGDFLDPTWCCMRESHTGLALPEAVEQHPLDVSPYGVRGMGGNVRDWCRNYYTRSGPPVYEDRAVITPIHDPDSPVQYRAVRGGAWNGATNDCRAAYRYGYLPESRLQSVGFRIVRPYEPSVSHRSSWSQAPIPTRERKP